MTKDHPADGGHHYHQADKGHRFLGAHDAADHQHVGQAQGRAGQQQSQGGAGAHAGAHQTLQESPPVKRPHGGTMLKRVHESFRFA